MNARRQVAIAGGGPAAAALALLLARRGLDVVVFEAAAVPRRKFGECLAPNTALLLERLGLAQYMAADGHVPSHGNRSVWGSDMPVEQDFIFQPYSHGWHLDRGRFEERLAGAARAAGADWRTGARVVRCGAGAAGIELAIEGPAAAYAINAEIAVDATGRNASVARLLGERQVRGPALIGTMATIDAGRGRVPSDTYTLIEAVDCGWWYSASLGDGSVIAGVMTDPHAAPRRPEVWAAMLERAPHTQARVRSQPAGAPPRIATRAAGPARLERFRGDRWLAVGDAAAAFDPISSYGIGSALGAAFEAADAICARLCGDSTGFRRFEMALNAAWHRCEAMRRDCYAQERRWPESPFWRHRAAPFEMPAASAGRL